MNLRIIVILCFMLTVFSCGQFAAKNESAETNDFARLDSAIAIYDTLILHPNLNDTSKSVKALAGYPPSAKRVAWYEIDYSPKSRGLAKIVCEDGWDTVFTDLDAPTISALSSLLQNEIVLIDTGRNKRIYSYKAALRAF